MKTSVEVSYYPLKESFKAPIRDFIDRLNMHNSIICKTSGMSTQLFGEYDDVMSAITAEIKKSFELPHSIFILKIVNSDLQKIPD